ncbi:hypothetical protein PTTG_02345 [Puccinia triticina 1-1 BBBD Race 1]|uniref:6-phosphogluconolactonase n=2 Tax=Puccinia triticina TaxID=208348 RepID=A0A180H3M4_PUCT1|nr:uncharacterized protein PtA15_4A204 [Puccinia triticina]OAV99122.1 hypothetical protein PTTG_02345 [Puccinia triticina 1-1 BBBD Race 1]WAQ83756.1 hypothetical protein PtA15_4A204 [Puccinia triticina]WAR54599.1 hypothetical protein PtB15_4B216 [Puccinia triticina]
MISMAIHKTISISTLAWFAIWCQISSAAPNLLDTLPASLQLYIGGESKEVKLFAFDTVQSTFTMQKATDSLGSNALWLDFDRSNKFILSTSAANFDKKEKTGGIFSAAVAADGTLQHVNAVPSPEAPVSLEVSPDGKLVMVASFNGASLTSYRLAADGKLSLPVQTFAFTGSGPIKSRQAAASAHQVKFDPSGTLLLVPDLGSDRIRSFSLDRVGNLKRNSDIAVKEGCGPRHLTFAPQRKGGPLRFYLICELSNEIFLIELPDARAKTAARIQNVTTLPQGANPKTFNAAEILLSPDGRFIYATNRQKDPAGRVDDNTFAIFARNENTDLLTPIGFSPAGGKGPRHCAFSPDKAASFMVVTNGESNLVTVHRRNVTSGALAEVASVPFEAAAVALFRVV